MVEHPMETRKRACFIGSLAILACLFGWTAKAQDGTSAPDTTQIIQWITQLDDDDFSARTDAVKSLRAAGRPALTALKKANAALQNNSEVRNIIEEMEAELPLRELATATADIEFDGTLDDAARAIEKTFGLEVQVENSCDLHSKKIKASLKGATWADAVAAICKDAPNCFSNSPRQVFLRDSPDSACVAQDGILYSAVCKQKYFARNQHEQWHPFNYVSLELSACVPSPYFLMEHCVVRDVVLINKDGTRHSVHDASGSDDYSEHCMWAADLAIDEQTMKAVGERSFDLECTISFVWPKRLRQCTFSYPPPIGKITVSSARQQQIHFVECKDNELSWKQEMSGDVHPPLLGWLVAHDQEAKTIGFTTVCETSGDGNIGGVNIAHEKHCWAFEKRPKSLVYTFAEAQTKVEKKIVFKGLRLPQTEPR